MSITYMRLLTKFNTPNSNDSLVVSNKSKSRKSFATTPYFHITDYKIIPVPEQIFIFLQAPYRLYIKDPK
jgi:hypothetical protein